MIKIIYFDLGGVIFSDFFSGAEKEFAEKLHIPVQKIVGIYTATDDPEYCKNRLSDKDRWTTFVRGLDLPEDKVSFCIDEFYKSYKLFSESLSFLKKLYEEKNYKLGILSDQPLIEAKYLKAAYDAVFSLFDPSLIIISAEVQLSKKDYDLRIYYYAIEKSGVKPDEILFVDNSLQNTENAQSAGMNTFYFDIKSKTIEILFEELQKKLSDK